MNNFTDSEAASTKAYARFSGNSKFEGLAENAEIGKLANHILRVRDQVRHLKTSGTVTDAAAVVQVDDLFSQQESKLKAMSDAAYDVLEKRTKDARSELYTEKAMVSIEEAPLQPLLYEKYQKASAAERREMIRNPSTARILAAVGRSGLMTPETLKAIDRNHTPEAVEKLDKIESDLRTMSNIEKEYRTFLNVNNDSKQAARLRELGSTEL